MEPLRLIPGQPLSHETLSQHDLLICLLDFEELVKLKGQLPEPLPLQFSAMQHMRPQDTGPPILKNLSTSQVCMRQMQLHNIAQLSVHESMRTHTQKHARTLSSFPPMLLACHLCKSARPIIHSYLFRGLSTNTKAKIGQVNFWQKSCHQTDLWHPLTIYLTLTGPNSPPWSLKRLSSIQPTMVVTLEGEGQRFV